MDSQSLRDPPDRGGQVRLRRCHPCPLRARSFLSAAGLTYGAFDFIVTADTEDYVFLECNAAGQWGWLAEECGLPIADAIADELIGDVQ